MTEIIIPANLKVVKRDGKKVEFNGDKIAIAIKKGFDSVINENYSEEDINKVYIEVCSQINDNYKDKLIIKVEDTQDLIEKVLLELGYEDIYNSFSEYRERRSESRKTFNKEFNKFVKTLEQLSLKDSKEEDSKRDNANVDGDTAMGTMLQYGATVSKEFAKAYFMKSKFAEAHESGQIHIHDMDFLPMGTTTCCQIDLLDLFKDGFSTGHGHLRAPKDIMSYTALAAIAIQSNQNDQHGGQSLPAFDFFMAPGVLMTFKKQFKQMLKDYLDLTDFIKFVNFDKVIKEISDLKSITIDIHIFDKYLSDSEELKRLFKIAYEKALEKTDRITYQAMEAFIHNLNTMHSRAGAQVPFSSINFGTDVSVEGRMVIKNYLLAADSGLGKNETPIFPISIFKLKEGINYNKEDPNYDLFELSCKVSAKRLFPNFSFMDSTFNKPFFKADDYRTQAAYMGCRTRVMANVADPDLQIVTGRGNLSFTSINLPRIGIKHGIVNGEKADMKAFYEEFGELIDLVKDQLLERFEVQCNRRIRNFPFLLGQGIWLDSKKLKPNDKLRKVLKHGTLTFGFIGLAECLVALTGKHHAQDKESEKLGLEIIKFYKDKLDEYAAKYKLNMTLIATPAEGLAGRFTKIDKAIYGIIPGVTDRSYYTNSFHVPVHYNISIAKKIEIEGPYHALTNAGHITYIELDGDPSNNLDAFMNTIRLMKDANIGYGAINHPVDRDPVCGFTGVIGDRCPGCGRNEDDIPFERIRRITGYLVGTVDRFNNGKQAEERDRVKHS